MQGLKALQMFIEQSQTEVRTCSFPDCMEATREGKHYCSNHVDQQPYVKDLLKRMANRTEEDEKVRLEGASSVNMEGITAKEILLQLRQSRTRTEERLTRELQIDKSIIHNYAIRLNRDGFIHFGRTNRNNLTIVLLDFDPSKAIEDEAIEDEDED